MPDSSLKQIGFLAAALLLNSASHSEEPAAQSNQVQGVSVKGAVLTEDSCEVLASRAGKKAELREAPGLHVLDKKDDDPLMIPAAADEKVVAVMCWRSEARLASNDYLVSQKAGVKLYVKTDTGNAATDRTIALENVNGGFRVRLLSGPDWSPAEEDEMIQAMTQFNKRPAQ